MSASPVHSQRRLIVAPAEPAAADKTSIALSFNGRTSDSDSLDRGSNPWGATKSLGWRTSSDFREPAGTKAKHLIATI